MLCPTCGFENPDNLVYCRKCGNLLAETQAAPHLTDTIADGEKRSLSRTIVGEKYRLKREIGRGGMGIVYEAEDLKLKRTVALKFLPPSLTRDAEARERFMHEAQAASQLDHPNICTVHEIDEHQGQMFIAMACYSGESLKDKIQGGPLAPRAAVDIALQTARGLAKAHGRGIIHRDIKPANLLVTEDSMLKIVDFGLAKLSDQTRITRSGLTLGTVAYMSPEQARGDPVDPRTDVWSLGAVLYEMVSGQLPFPGEKETAVIYSILNEDPRPLEKIRPDIPHALQEVIDRALDKDPAKRFASAKEMAKVLEGIWSHMTAEIPLVSTRDRGIRTAKLVLTGAAVGILLVAAAFILWTTLLRPSLAFSEQDQLLIADVDNQTEDEVFDTALRTALEVDIQQSPFATVFDKSQISDTLRLMKLNPASRIDEQLGMEICRFAGLRALILPRVLAAGEAYELHAVLIDPIRGRHVKQLRVRARSREEVLLTSIDDLAGQVRSSLGESLASIEKADKRVVQLTTSSWEALNYLTMGQAKWHESKFKEAATFFQLALEKDPEFVSARGSLGLLQIQFLNQPEEGKQALRQALIDAEGLPQREYLLISAVKKQYADEDKEGALEDYRLITDIFPDMMQAYNNAGMILRELGRLEEAIQMFEKSSAAAPRNSIPLGNLWWTHITYLRDPEAAEDAARRTLALTEDVAMSHHWLGYSLLAQARFEEAVEAYRKALALEPLQTYALPNMAYLLLALNKPSEAAPFLETVLTLIKEQRRQGHLPSACFDLAYAWKLAKESKKATEIAAEGEASLRAELPDVNTKTWGPLILAKLALVRGADSEAEDYLNMALAREDSGSPEFSVYFAEVYSLKGENEKSMTKIREAIASGGSDPYFLQLLPAFYPLRTDPRFPSLFRNTGNRP